MTPPCVYCGRDAGEHDEHEACLEASLNEALEEAELEAELDVVLIGSELEATPEGLYWADRIRDDAGVIMADVDELVGPAARIELERRLDAAILGL